MRLKDDTPSSPPLKQDAAGQPKSPHLQFSTSRIGFVPLKSVYRVSQSISWQSGGSLKAKSLSSYSIWHIKDFYVCAACMTGFPSLLSGKFD